MFDLNKFIFTSSRLGFRNWKQEDVSALHEINTDPEVMKYFPSIPTKEDTVEFIHRMQKLFMKSSYCYFAVERLDNFKLIGFFGLSSINFENKFSSSIDLGCRSRKSEWNQGFATEGAKRCIQFGFERLNIPSMIAIAPKVNLKSELVMKKAGLSFVEYFIHPKLKEHKELEECVLYEIKNSLSVSE